MAVRGGASRIPKRSEEHADNVGSPGTHTHYAGEAQGAPKPGVTRLAVDTKPKWPNANPNWDASARRWYLSLRKSGQSIYYEQSDIETAYFLASELSLLQMGQTTRSNRGEILRAVLSGMSLLLNTEGDRRRAGIELVREKVEKVDPAKVAMDKYRDMLKKPAVIHAVPDAEPVRVVDVPPTEVTVTE